MRTDKGPLNKIGILTYHHTTNFGSLLQTYALAKKTEELGYEYEIIDYRNDAVETREAPMKLRRCRSLREIRDYFKYDWSKKRKAEAFADFTRKYLKISDKVYCKDNIKESADVYQTFLVGSDLVWDFSINGNDRTYMLDFAPDAAKKAAYASSAGTVWNREEIPKVQGLLTRFHYIGVREHAIQQMMNTELGISADFVGDPTMLMEPEYWKRMASPRLIHERYVLVYFCDKDLKIYENAARYGKEHNLPVYQISYSWVPETMKPIRPARIEDFLSLILNADTVFTASYHGMLFSLYFEKNFYYYNRGWKARMESIASFLGIKEREHWTGENISLDYREITQKIDSLRTYSADRLREYLQS